MIIAFPGLKWGIAGALLALVGIWALLVPWRKGSSVLRFSDVKPLKEAIKGRRILAEPIQKGLRSLLLVLLAIALFRPQSGQAVEELLSPGVDIVIALDLSDTMRAEDMGNRTRVEAAKEVVSEFIKGRTHDRIGLVVFAARAYTQCPLTLDYALLERLVSELTVGTIKSDATAIGMGLATALNRLKDSKARSKVIILATDGRNNSGSIEPETAAEMAKSLGVRIYAVGVASRGPARIKVKDYFGREVYTQIMEDLNEPVLTSIARTTGGIFRRAADSEALSAIFNEISALEKTPVKVRVHHQYSEAFLYLGIPAVLLLLTELVLASTVLRRIP
ncbi:MAG: VWA domain-containing protein [Candidatus Riflebacteria bacterium]|nr:VWA domain-containing protein [Candidatus Riflebacteria bacterium]